MPRGKNPPARNHAHEFNFTNPTAETVGSAENRIH